MVSSTPPEKALLFVGTFFTKENYYTEAQALLERRFGEIVMETPLMKWDFSSHRYRKEMGEPLYRRFMFFKGLIEQDAIASIKLATNSIEDTLAVNGKRTINLDPGYLTPAKLVLASTKDYSHRIYLRDGIYAEITLIFQHGGFLPHINTYRDYQDEKYLKFFMAARNLLMLLKNYQQ